MDPRPPRRNHHRTTQARTVVISDEAVEAARVSYLREFNYDENAEYIARLVLEAAAPYMLADLVKKADECTTGDMDNYFIDQADVGGWLRSMVNPYRRQA